MTISELIERLEALKTFYGEVQVIVPEKLARDPNPMMKEYAGYVVVEI